MYSGRDYLYKIVELCIAPYFSCRPDSDKSSGLLAQVFTKPFLVIFVGAEYKPLCLRGARLVRFYRKTMGRNTPQLR